MMTTTTTDNNSDYVLDDFNYFKADHVSARAMSERAQLSGMTGGVFEQYLISCFTGFADSLKENGKFPCASTLVKDYGTIEARYINNRVSGYKSHLKRRGLTSDLQPIRKKAVVANDDNANDNDKTVAGNGPDKVTIEQTVPPKEVIETDSLPKENVLSVLDAIKERAIEGLSLDCSMFDKEQAFRDIIKACEAMTE